MLKALAILLLMSASANAMDTLVYLNAQSASLGMYPLIKDMNLQRAAESAARQRAYKGIRGHLRGKRPVAGNLEGVAVRNSRQRGPANELWGPEDVYACYQATGTSKRGQSFSFGRARYAGCASVLGRDGYYYYQVNLR